MDTVIGSLRRVVCASLLCACLGACIGVSPEQRLAKDLGPDTGGHQTGPLHRAGFPCTDCHGPLWWQDHPTFELAGTVYQSPTDDAGQRGAHVIIQDANGQTVTAVTNSVGNFFVVTSGGNFRGSSEGSLVVPAGFKFPLRVSVKTGSVEQKMRSLIWRETSCANCHAKKLGAGSNGRVFAMESTP